MDLQAFFCRTGNGVSLQYEFRFQHKDDRKLYKKVIIQCHNSENQLGESSHKANYKVIPNILTGIPLLNVAC